MAEEFELEVVLRGQEHEAKYGSIRDTLARLEVPVEGHRGWAIYQAAVSAAVAGGAKAFICGEAMAQEIA